MRRYFMGIDIGTTGGRACVFDDEGNLIGRAYQEYPCHYPEEGFVEQYAAELLPALYQTSREAIAASGISADTIEAVALSTPGPVLCLLDENFELMTPLIGWQDLRGAAYMGKAAEAIGDVNAYYEETGAPFTASNPVGKLLWLKNERSKEWKECAYIATATEYFNKKFGAWECVTDPTMASRMMIMDIHNGCFSKAIIEKLGIEEKKLAKIVPCGEIIGEITEELSKLTGLAVGTKLVMGALDQNTSTLGLGMLIAGQAGFKLGTAGLLTTVIEKPKFHDKGMLIVKPNACVGDYTLEGISFSSASAYRWYRDTFCQTEKDAADKLGISTYDIMNQLARKSKPGACGVTFLNYLQGAAGVVHNYQAQGTFTGLTFGTTKSDITRAVMEGIVYEEKTMLDAMYEMGIPITEMRLSGGGANSRTWAQMHADILEVPIVLLQTSELSALGASMLAGIGVGVYSDIQDAVEKCIHIEKTYMPNKKLKTAYEKAYQKYMNCYETMSKGNVWA